MFGSNIDWTIVAEAAGDTMLMLVASLAITIVLGLPLGVALYATGRGRILENRILNAILSFVVNVLRSVPFIILLIVMLPVTVLLVGTSLGVAGAIPPLVVGAAPFYARLVETALREVERGMIEATQAMGGTTWQIVRRVLLPEALPGLIGGMTVSVIAMVNASAMAGAVGAGGLGDLAIRYGYERYETRVMFEVIVILVALVSVLQFGGEWLARRADHRRSIS